MKNVTTFREDLWLIGPEEAKWWERVVSLASTEPRNPREELRELGIEANESTLTMLESYRGYWPGFSIEIKERDGIVTLRSNTCHDFEVLVCILQAFTAQFCPGLIFSMIWSDSVSGSAPSGGVLIVTKDTYICESTIARRAELVQLARKMKGY